MKKMFQMAGAAMTVILMLGCSPKQQVTIQGNVEGLEGKVWLVSRSDGAVDSTTAAGGKFTIKTAPGSNIRMYIADNPSLMDADFTAMFLMEPGTVTIERTSDMENAKVSGTPGNDGYSQFMSQLDQIEYKMYEAEEDEETERLEKEYNDLLEVAYQANIDNAAGLMFLRNLSYGIVIGQELDARLESMSDALKDTKEWKTLKNTAEKQVMTAIGKPYLDFTQPNADGVGISLKSVVEKPGNRYLLLDFWASWCGPCMGEVPYMVQDYAEFHDLGFEIFGSSLDQKKESWLKAVSEKEMNWVHVSDLKYWENSAANLYGVSAIPSNFLIDCATGLIVARDLRGNGLRAKLQELLHE